MGSASYKTQNSGVSVTTAEYDSQRNDFDRGIRWAEAICVKSFISYLPYCRVATGQGKVREFCNWSGKFGILRKVREFWNWSGKFDFLMSYAQ